MTQEIMTCLAHFAATRCRSCRCSCPSCIARIEWKDSGFKVLYLTCRISRETFRGRSLESTIPLTKVMYRGSRLSSNSSLMKTRFTNNLMFLLLLSIFCNGWKRSPRFCRIIRWQWCYLYKCTPLEMTAIEGGVQVRKFLSLASVVVKGTWNKHQGNRVIWVYGGMGKRVYLVLKWCHSGNVEKGAKFYGAFHVEVGMSSGLKELLERGFEEAVVLVLSHLDIKQRPAHLCTNIPR